MKKTRVQSQVYPCDASYVEDSPRETDTADFYKSDSPQSFVEVWNMNTDEYNYGLCDLVDKLPFEQMMAKYGSFDGADR